MDTQTPAERKLCLFQWVFVLLMGLLGSAIGAMTAPDAAPLLERLPGLAAGLLIGLTVSGVGVSFYLRWKRSRVRSESNGSGCRRTNG